MQGLQITSVMCARARANGGKWETLHDPTSSPSEALQAPIPDDACDTPALRAESPMPAPGTPQRAALDRRQAEMVAGLLAGFARHGRQRA